MTFQLFNTKMEGINILKEYFRKLSSYELGYYLEKSSKMSIQEFMNLNVYSHEDIELLNLFFLHLTIVIKKIFDSDLSSELKCIKKPIKISFVSNSIHWKNLFVISNNIFVKYQYLIDIFECMEYNEYKSMSDVYIEGEKIFDMGLLKEISYSIYSILQNVNSEAWNKYISNKYGCTMVPIDNIKFKSKYKIIQEPNVDFMQGKIPVYWLDSDNIYASFNLICSKDNTFSPYWEQQIIKLEYMDGYYIEKNQIDINEYGNKTMLFENNLLPSPFENKSIQITNTIIHN